MVLFQTTMVQETIVQELSLSPRSLLDTIILAMDDLPRELGKMNVRRFKAPAPTGERKILVAVDFGTTYSAVAWLQTRVNNAQSGSHQPLTCVVDEWPEKADTQDKVPTTLQYDDKHGSPSKWGFETNVDPAESKYQWFKLELDPKLRTAVGQRKYPKGTIEADDEDHVEKLITDYLTLLRKHAQDRIKASFASYENLLKGVIWEYIITVPAVWPEGAQNTTRRCAVKAGMAPTSPVQIITEPEAAGIYALEHMTQEIGLKVGDTFVICDAGGGTVDLISYTITSLSPTRLEESAPGNGELCGSTFLDRRFDQWLSQKFSGFFRWDDGYHADALARWESEIKRNFTGDTHKKFFIPARGLPDSPQHSIRGSKFEISGREVKSLFEPVIREILGLVRSQIQITEARNSGRGPKAVLLAGGFGRNEYLKRRIQAEVGEAVRVERMKDCNTAIVRGALIRGLAPKQPRPGRLPNIWVESRIARRHYGTVVLVEYDRTKHDPSRPRVEGGVNGKDRIEIMQWFIEKGSKVMESEPVPHKYYFDMSLAEVLQKGGKLDEVTMDLYTCDDDNKPTYLNDKCRHLVRLTADLNQIPKETLGLESGLNNEMFYKIPFRIDITCHSADISFDLVHEGKKYGSVRAQYM